MKRFIYVFMALCLSFRAGAFDGGRIVASFGVVSDVHIESQNGTPSVKFVTALQQLRDKAAEQDADGLDAVLVDGDLINTAFSSESNYVQVDWFRKLYEQVFDPRTMPMVYTPGNHDTYKWWTPETIKQSKNISERLGENYFLKDVDMDARNTLECRHCIINGYHILCIVPVGASPVVYTPQSVAWLDRQLSEITSAQPDRFVIVLTHPMIKGTVYGSELGDYWATEALTPVLSKYPQVVTFGGHLHFPLNDPRSIWQGAFTALGCGSVRYMAIEDGGYEYMRSKTVPVDADDFSQGLLLQLDADGNMRLTRMDFFHKTTIAEPWIVPAPAKDNSHLNVYGHETRSKADKAPKMGRITVEKKHLRNRGGVPVSVRFASATDDEFAHHYVITLSCADSVYCTKKVLSDFYRHASVSDMKSEWSQPLCSVGPGKYQVKVTAVDSWGKESKPAICKFKVGESEGLLVQAPVEHDWMFYGNGPYKLNINAEGTTDGTESITMALVTDLSLMSEKKDTILLSSADINLRGESKVITFDLGAREPGFYQVNISSGKEGIARFNIGINPEQIVSPQDKPEDFDEFWASTLSELSEVPIDATLTVDPAHSNADRTTYIVKMKSFGGVEIGGTLCKPNKPGKYITYIDYLGYGANPYNYDPSANPEVVEFLLSVRDQGILKRAGHYRWIDRGLDSKENFYYRGAFCDVVRAIDYICSLDCVDMEHLYARGESQGGAFTLISVSLDHRIKACAPSVPFLSDYPDYSRIVRWPMWEVFDECAKQGISRDSLFRMLRYFDVKNFTDRIQCPVYMAYGLQDGTCPPHTNFAGYNQIKAPKHYYCSPKGTHDTWKEQGWYDARAAWFREIIGK